jgi:hypothetical protein
VYNRSKWIEGQKAHSGKTQLTYPNNRIFANPLNSLVLPPIDQVKLALDGVKFGQSLLIGDCGHRQSLLTLGPSSPGIVHETCSDGVSGLIVVPAHFLKDN